MEKSIFERIAARELPGHIIWENERFCAFLSIAPIKPGHTLVVPKINLGDHIFDLADVDLADLMLASKKVAHLLKEKLNAERIVVLVEGFEVPHVHIHLLPASGNGIKKGPIPQATTEELTAMWNLITNS